MYKTIYSDKTYLCLTRVIRESWWTRAEIMYHKQPIGTRILTHRAVNNGIITKYVSTRTADGFIRYTITFMEGVERDPYPVDIVYTDVTTEHENICD
jgi:hypothetical protein